MVLLPFQIHFHSDVPKSICVYYFRPLISIFFHRLRSQQYHLLQVAQNNLSSNVVTLRLPYSGVERLVLMLVWVKSLSPAITPRPEPQISSGHGVSMDTV